MKSIYTHIQTTPNEAANLANAWHFNAGPFEYKMNYNEFVIAEWCLDHYMTNHTKEENNALLTSSNCFARLDVYVTPDMKCYYTVK